MNNKRFVSIVRCYETKALPFVAYLTDKATGAKFQNSFETKAEATAWLNQSKDILANGFKQ